MSETVPPVIWITSSVTALITAIATAQILKSELHKRNSIEIVFTTKWIKSLPLLCIGCGIIFTMFGIITDFPIFCYFIAPLQYALIPTQAILMGFYQLSRLYYCFSQNQVHSTKGYSNYVFIIMYTIGIINAINVWIFPWFAFKDNIVGECGINDKYQYYVTKATVRRIPSVVIWIGTTSFIYLLWDFTTLALYTIKVISFHRYKSEQIVVYNRIMSILKRIMILTILYEIMTIICIITLITGTMNSIITEIMYRMSWYFGSVSFSYSIFLMQQHNTDEYYRFVRIFCNLKLHNIFCCCKSVLVEVVQSESEEMKDNRKITQSPWDTRDIPVKETHSIIVKKSLPTTLIRDLNANIDT